MTMTTLQAPGALRGAVGALDTWIRTRFVELNTELEERYWAQPNRSSVAGGDDLKAMLADEGQALIAAIDLDVDLDRDLALDFDTTFALLGEVGYFMAACRRHEITEPSPRGESRLRPAHSLALRLAAVLGTAPRFMTAHMETHNPAVNGVYRTFTSYEAERVFLDYNTRSAFAYMRAADALVRTLPLGVSHPVTFDLLVEAERGLTDALNLNQKLSAELDVDRFFFCVRPYYKPHRVGSQEFRGANAGDFAAFSEVDTLLGLCSMGDLSYSQLTLGKLPYLVPDEQRRLRETVRHPNLLDMFLQQVSAADETWFRRNAAAFLRVCDAHGAAAAQHHDELVGKFIKQPSTAIPPEHLEGLTASGPPLDVLLRALERLRDQRLAANRDDIPTRHHDIAALRALVEVG